MKLSEVKNKFVIIYDDRKHSFIDDFLFVRSIEKEGVDVVYKCIRIQGGEEVGFLDTWFGMSYSNFQAKAVIDDQHIVAHKFLDRIFR